LEALFRFAASGVVGVIVATTTLVILSQYTNVFVAKFVSILAAFGFNFSMSHFVVFRAVPKAGPL
jgi:putative flippase GtrA